MSTDYFAIFWTPGYRHLRIRRWQKAIIFDLFSLYIRVGRLW